MAGLTEFLEESPMARKVKLPATVVLKRMRMSALDLLSLKDRGEFGPIGLSSRGWVLEVGGQRAAEGRVVLRRGRPYLKITKVVFSEAREEGGST